MSEKIPNGARISELWGRVKEELADAVTVPGGGVMELGPELGEGPYTFELTPDEETAVSAEQVSYDGAQSGIQAETVQGAIDGLDARIARMSGVNLVDNGYFADPVNQRGKAEYAGGFTIDRFATDGLTVTLEDGWLKLQNKTEATHYFVQNKDPSQFKGVVKERVTQSLLYKDNTPGCAVYWGYSADGAEFISAVYTILPDGEGEKLYCGTSDVLPDVTAMQWQAFGFSVPPGGMCRFKATKLELGPVQTLAHKEGDAWVLNDPPPDKALELLKCQRYFVSITCVSGYPLSTVVADGNGAALFPVSLPANMRSGNPSIITDCQLRVRTSAGNHQNVSVESVGILQGNVLNLAVLSLTPNTVYSLDSATNGRIYIDANL